MVICLYGASSENIHPAYITGVEALGRAMGRRGHSLLFGGGDKGLMGAAARGTKAAGGAVITPKPAKKKTGLIAGLAAIAVVVVVVLVMVLTSKPYMKPVKDFMKQVNSHNTNYMELYQALMPDFAAKEVGKVYKQIQNSDELMENVEDSIQRYENFYENATDEFGEWKLSFEFKKAELLEDDDFENIQDAIEDYYRNNSFSYSIDTWEAILDDEDDLEDYADDLDINEKQAKALLNAYISYYSVYKDVEVTEVYEVKGKFIIKADGEEMDTDTVKFYMAKVNGDWTYYAFIDGDLSFDGDDGNYFYFIRSMLNSGKYFTGLY